MLKLTPSPIQSQSFRQRTEKVDTLVLHYTALDTDASLRVLRYRDVSVHYVLSPQGEAFQILQNDQVGWHAGLSLWRGKPNLNGRSIGVEIVNLDGNVNPYPAAQMDALVELCQKILQENPGITPGNVVGHSDIAPKRKVDPGKLFPWQQLAAKGIGRWPGGAQPQPVGSAKQIQALLEACGYAAEHAYGVKSGGYVFVSDPANPPPGVGNVTRVKTADILRACQLHYQPNAATGVADAQTMGLLRALSQM